MKNTLHSGYTKHHIILFGAILLITNIILGSLLVSQSAKTAQTLIRKNMLDISDTAAAFVSGDRFEKITEDDIGSRDYNEIYRDLAVFRDHVNIEYIYAVRPVDENTFVFIVDTDTEEPADYGEEVVISEALLMAAKGVSAVDTVTVEDRWGNFYSSYSPVFNHAKEVVGIVGVDFNSEWFDSQVRRNSILSVVFSVLFTAGGAILMLIIGRRFNRRVAGLNNELDTAHSEAMTDGLTGLGNSRSYNEKRSEMNRKIAEGTADFAIVFFDIDYLKKVNDKFGHSCGDRLICEAADKISEAFEKYDCFRIGGDEIAVIAEGIRPGELKELLAELSKPSIVLFDASDENAKTELSLSKGYAFFDPEKDGAFVEVFMRADGNMYEDKQRHHIIPERTE